MEYLVYDVPGRADYPFDAHTLDDARRWVEANLSSSIPKNARKEWVASGGGHMLTVRSQRGQMLAHLWLRPETRIPVEAGSARADFLAVTFCTLLLIAVALGLMEGWLR